MSSFFNLFARPAIQTLKSRVAGAINSKSSYDLIFFVAKYMRTEGHVTTKMKFAEIESLINYINTPSRALMVGFSTTAATIHHLWQFKDNLQKINALDIPEKAKQSLIMYESFDFVKTAPLIPSIPSQLATEYAIEFASEIAMEKISSGLNKNNDINSV